MVIKHILRAASCRLMSANLPGIVLHSFLNQYSMPEMNFEEVEGCSSEEAYCDLAGALF